MDEVFAHALKAARAAHPGELRHKLSASQQADEIWREMHRIDAERARVSGAQDDRRN